MALVAAELHARIRQLLPELLKFGIVGGTGTVVDIGGAALLHGVYHVGPLEAKAASTTAATVITYLGSRFWTFKERENQDLKREAVLFIVLNLVGLLIAEVVVAVVTYAMSLHGQLEYNIASFLGTGFGTIFRYFAYKKWVFLAPGEEAAATSRAPAPQPFPDYSPWEFDPAFMATAGHAPRSRHRAPAPAFPSGPSGWNREPAPSWDPALAPTMSWSVPAPQPAPVRQPSPVRQPVPVRQPAPMRGTVPMPPPAPVRGTAPMPPPPAARAQDYPAPAYPPPAPQPPRRPAPARFPGPRSSGGGRHRKT